MREVLKNGMGRTRTSDEQCGQDRVCGDESRTCLVGCRGDDDGDSVCADVEALDLSFDETLTLDSAEICLGDRDHVRVATGPSERLTVEVALGEGEGELGLQILDGCDGAVLAVGQLDGDVLVAETLAPPTGALVVRISGQSYDATRAYTMTLTRGDPFLIDLTNHVSSIFPI